MAEEGLFQGAKKVGYPREVKWHVLEGEDRDFSTGDTGGDQLIISVYGLSPPGRVSAFRGQDYGLFCSLRCPQAPGGAPVTQPVLSIS